MVQDAFLQPLLQANPHHAESFGAILEEPTFLDVSDISDAVLYLSSDMSRHVTGIQLPVDRGATTV